MNSSNKTVNKLLTEEMDRKQFLVRVGAAVLALTGVAGLIKAVTNPYQTKRVTGYGASPYGGDGKSVNLKSVSQ